MAMPLQVINILSQMTRRNNNESVDCHECHGQGEIMAFHPETGHEAVECPECLGSGYNTLGLIVNQLLKPPKEGYGPAELREILNEAQKQTPKQK